MANTPKIQITGLANIVPPTVDLPWAAYTTIPANQQVNPITIAGTTTFTLGEGLPNAANRWEFAITQGSTAYTINLPAIQWPLGIAPSFAANTTTEIILYYVGSTLKGVWN